MSFHINRLQMERQRPSLDQKKNKLRFGAGMYNRSDRTQTLRRLAQNAYKPRRRRTDIGFVQREELEHEEEEEKDNGGPRKMGSPTGALRTRTAPGMSIVDEDSDSTDEEDEEDEEDNSTASTEQQMQGTDPYSTVFPRGPSPPSKARKRTSSKTEKVTDGEKTQRRRSATQPELPDSTPDFLQDASRPSQMLRPDAKRLKVSVRVRGLIAAEVERKEKLAWRVVGGDTVVRIKLDSMHLPRQFHFDHVFGKNVRNEGIYDDFCKPVVDGVLDGFNGCIFAYGQTASGKTYTMSGTPDSPGIIVQALISLLSLFAEHKSEGTTSALLQCAFLEIYNDEIRDLCPTETSKQKKLRLQETPDAGVVVSGLSHRPIASVEEGLEVLRQGSQQRATGATRMNADSSRSHSILRLVLEVRRGTRITRSILNMVDLAGSESTSKAGTTGTRRREGSNINKSLLTLGTVIHELSRRSKGKKIAHIPFRDSKLTRLLQPCLGGNSQTVLIATISPTLENVNESKATLRFAHRASTIVSRVKRVTLGDKSPCKLKLLERQVSALQKALESARNQNEEATPVVRVIRRMKSGRRRSISRSGETNTSKSYSLRSLEKAAADATEAATAAVEKEHATIIAELEARNKELECEVDTLSESFLVKPEPWPGLMQRSSSVRVSLGLAAMVVKASDKFKSLRQRENEALAQPHIQELLLNISNNTTRHSLGSKLYQKRTVSKLQGAMTGRVSPRLDKTDSNRRLNSDDALPAKLDVSVSEPVPSSTEWRDKCQQVQDLEKSLDESKKAREAEKAHAAEAVADVMTRCQALEAEKARAEEAVAAQRAKLDELEAHAASTERQLAAALNLLRKNGLGKAVDTLERAKRAETRKTNRLLGEMDKEVGLLASRFAREDKRRYQELHSDIEQLHAHHSTHGDLISVLHEKWEEQHDTHASTLESISALLTELDEQDLEEGRW